LPGLFEESSRQVERIVMFLFLVVIASIIICTGIINILYVLYKELINPMHPALSRVWLGVSIGVVLSALLAEFHMYRKEQKRQLDANTVFQDKDPYPNLPTIKLVDAK